MKRLFGFVVMLLFGCVVFSAVLITFTDNLDTMRLLQKGTHWVTVVIALLFILFAMVGMFKRD